MRWEGLEWLGIRRSQSSWRTQHLDEGSRAMAPLTQIGVTIAYVSGFPASQWQGLDEEEEKVNVVACGCDGPRHKQPAVSSVLGSQSWMSTFGF